VTDAGPQLPRPVAFVLGGGASFGAVQVGMLQALSEIDLTPDLVVGTSVGSLNGALVAEDPRGAANRLTHLWMQVTRETVFPGRVVDRMRTWRQHRTFFVQPDGLRDLLTSTLASERIEDLALPFAATAMDLATGRVVHLDSGPLVPALLASAAVPGVYPSVRINDRDLVDGGVVSKVPVAQALRMGARSIVVLDCGAFRLRPETPRKLPELVAHVVAIMMRQQVVRDVPVVAREVPVLYLPGPYRMTSSPLEFVASPRLMKEAYEKTRAFLGEVKPSGPGLYGDAPLVTGLDDPLLRDVQRWAGPGAPANCAGEGGG
jgi:NTE family protein